MACPDFRSSSTVTDGEGSDSSRSRGRRTGGCRPVWDGQARAKTEGAAAGEASRGDEWRTGGGFGRRGGSLIGVDGMLVLVLLKST